MNCERFEKNLTDNVREAQLKLGYDGRPMSLNYMFSTLKHLLGSQSEEEIIAEISQLSSYLGQLSLRKIRDGVCITIPAEGTAFVHSQTTGKEFISDLVGTVANHGISLENVLDVFRRHGQITVEESGSGEFDYLVKFVDGQPDDYRYCLTLEPCMGGGCHVTYHRFIAEDYDDLGF